MKTRRAVYSALIAALYAVLTIVLSPISFGPLQFRASNLLVGLMFYDIDYCFGLALGVFLGNLASPFGPLDWAIMPFVTLAGALSAYFTRKYWYVGIILWSVITSLGVAIFPLGLGAQIPFIATFPFILVSQLVVGTLGYFIFRPFSKLLILDN